MPDDGSDGTPAAAFPSRRVVLIGASNLALGLPAVIDAARRNWGNPLDVMAALGHGRSYGADSRLLWRTLPGITSCRLWEELRQRPPATTAALLTDIGNDILFGVPVQEILCWVEACLERLAAVSKALLITAPPMESIDRIGPARFLLMRTILYPRSRIDLRGARDAARVLHDRLIALADRHGARWVVPSRAWYGFDPIHVRRAQRTGAWQQILSHWQSSPCDAAAVLASQHPSLRMPIGSRMRIGLRERIRLRASRPDERGIFGRRRHHRQPTAVLADGTMISLF